MIQNNVIFAIAAVLLIVLYLRFSRRRYAGRSIVSVLCAFSVLFSGFCPLFATVSAEAADTSYHEQCLELHPDKKQSEEIVTLNGVMPNNARAEVTDVTESFETLAEKDNEENHIIAAYDITIMNGSKEYQPQEGKPILVEIANTDIKKDNVSVLWHIKDDGTKEEIKDFTVKDGKVSFYAKSFSVYAVVEVPLPASSRMEQARQASDLVSERGQEAGFYVYYGYGNYFKNTVKSANSNNAVNNGVIEVDTDIDEAAVWRFEEAVQSGNTYYKMYTYVEDVKKYIYSTHINNENNIGLTEDAAQADILEIASSNNNINYPNSFYIKKYDTDKKYLQYSSSGHGIRYYDGSLKNGVVTNINMIIRFNFTDGASLPSDYYRLNGKSYGLMNYTGLSLGNALMVPVEPDDNHIDLITMYVKEDT